MAVRCGKCSDREVNRYHATSAQVRACHTDGSAQVVKETARFAKATPEAPTEAEVPAEPMTAHTLPEGRFTVVMAFGSGEHRTFLAQRQDDDADFMPGRTILSFLSGPDNTRNYTSFAHLDEDGRLRVWKRFRDDSDLVNAVKVLLASDPDDAREAYAMESGKCSRCGRVLTVPASLNRGLGPVCAEKEAA